jgi:hypothetical protein
MNAIRMPLGESKKEMKVVTPIGIFDSFSDAAKASRDEPISHPYTLPDRRRDQTFTALCCG